MAATVSGLGFRVWAQACLFGGWNLVYGLVRGWELGLGFEVTLALGRACTVAAGRVVLSANQLSAISAGT